MARPKGTIKFGTDMRVNFSPVVKEKARNLAHARGQTLSQFVRQAVDRAVQCREMERTAHG